LRIATLQAPGKWPGRDNEYVTLVDAPANAAAVFQGGSYDEEIIWYTEAVKQPMAVIELLTLTIRQKFLWSLPSLLWCVQ
jgi:hypothetical protein